jgi:hypothetical protein
MVALKDDPENQVVKALQSNNLREDELWVEMAGAVL